MLLMESRNIQTFKQYIEHYNDIRPFAKCIGLHRILTTNVQYNGHGNL